MRRAIHTAERSGSAGQHYVSAPVFGRPESAAAAKLWVVAAGEEAAVKPCRPLFDAIGQGVFVVGTEPEKANVIKIAGNFTHVALIETLGEAYALLRKHDVDPKDFLALLNGALYKSPIYESYGTLIAEERWEPAGFRLRLGLKDVRLALQAAEATATPMPLASLARDHYLAALAKVVARQAGLEG